MVGDFRYWEARRKNKLPTGIGLASGVCERKTISYYSYDPAQFFDLCAAGKATHILLAQTVNLGNAKTKVVWLHL